MSVKRWKETESWGFTEGDCMAVMEECADGEYVLYSDYAILKAEVERLRAASFVTAVPVEQYERLRKAGDAMAECVLKDCIHKNDVAALRWYDAKEGKQP